MNMMTPAVKKCLFIGLTGFATAVCGVLFRVNGAMAIGLHFAIAGILVGGGATVVGFLLVAKQQGEARLRDSDKNQPFL